MYKILAAAIGFLGLAACIHSGPAPFSDYNYIRFTALESPRREITVFYDRNDLSIRILEVEEQKPYGSVKLEMIFQDDKCSAKRICASHTIDRVFTRDDANPKTPNACMYKEPDGSIKDSIFNPYPGTVDALGYQKPEEVFNDAQSLAAKSCDALKLFVKGEIKKEQLVEQMKR